MLCEVNYNEREMIFELWYINQGTLIIITLIISIFGWFIITDRIIMVNYLNFNGTSKTHHGYNVTITIGDCIFDKPDW